MRKIEDSTAKSDADLKSVRQLRIRHQIRYSDIEDQRPDPVLRYWIFLTNLGQFRIQSDNEGHSVCIFLDTGENYNTITRKFILLFFTRKRFKMCFLSGLKTGYGC